MKRFAKIAAGVLSLAMLGTMAACGAKTEPKQSSVTEPQTTAAPATKDSAVDPLKGVFDKFIKNETYTSLKSGYTGAKFDEKFSSDGITITVTGSEYIDGEYKFPVKDGYLTCELWEEDYFSPVVFTQLTRSVGEFWGIDPHVFDGYINALGTKNIESKVYSVEHNEDEYSPDVIKVYYAEKPEMKELNDFYIDESALSLFEDDTTNYSVYFGKLHALGYLDNDTGAMIVAVGEYGDKNTDLTLKSMKEIVKYFQPVGAEDFDANYTELKDVTTDAYSVSSDSAAFEKTFSLTLDKGYKYTILNFGYPTGGTDISEETTEAATSGEAADEAADQAADEAEEADE